MPRITVFVLSVVMTLEGCGVDPEMDPPLSTNVSAVCADPPCEDPDPTPTPTPNPMALYSMSPDFGWSGDSVRFEGQHLVENVQVTVNGIAATIIYAGHWGSSVRDIVDVLIPLITTNIAGPQSVPVVLTSDYGSVSASFTLSPTLVVGAAANWDSIPGRAEASISVDRQSGFVHGDMTVQNLQTWAPLAINVSAVWSNASGRVIGFTNPHGVTAPGVFFCWPSDSSIAVGTWTDMMGPNPGVAPHIHSGTVLIVRDHDAELLQALNDAVALGKTIKQVIDALAALGAL